MKQLWREIKGWLLVKIIMFFIDTPPAETYIEGVDKMINELSRESNRNGEQIQALKNRLYKSENRLRNIEQLYQVAVNAEPDRGKNSGSWAVICLNGQPEYITFVRMKGAYVRDIYNFLKTFESKGNIIVDRPPGIDLDSFFQQ